MGLSPAMPARRIALLLTACVTALVVGTASTAAAHDAVVATEPADQAVLTVAPVTTSVTFSDAPLDISSQMVLTAADGTVVVDSPATLTGTTAAISLPALPNGDYTVAWRLVAQDGHPVQGTYGFTVAVPEATPASPAASTPPPTTAEASATPTSAAGTEPEVMMTALAEPSDAAPSDASTDAGDGGSGFPVPLAIAFGAVVAVAVVAMIGQRRRRTAESPAAGDDGDSPTTPTTPSSRA